MNRRRGLGRRASGLLGAALGRARPESALVVPAPSAAAAIAPAGLGPAQDGLGLHVTLLWPFLPPRQIDEQATARLRDLFADYQPFAFELTAVGSFPGVTWLKPEPAAPFAGLLEGLRALHPEHPPYGGAYEEDIFHVTFATGPPPAVEVLDTVRSQLPVTEHAGEVWLATRHGGRWTTRAIFPLGH